MPVSLTPPKREDGRGSFSTTWRSASCCAPVLSLRVVEDNLGICLRWAVEQRLRNRLEVLLEECRDVRAGEFYRPVGTRYGQGSGLVNQIIQVGEGVVVRAAHGEPALPTIKVRPAGIPGRIGARRLGIHVTEQQ